ncbi:hypothetical protein ACSQ67_019612 [Phaseolus vulgaris]
MEEEHRAGEVDDYGEKIDWELMGLWVEILRLMLPFLSLRVCGILRWEAMAWRGHLSKNIKELRFLMCQSSSASSSARAFVEKNYKELKTLNPKLPILIRECSGVEPQLWARYDLGVEKGIRLEGLSEAQIFKALEDLVKAGQSKA